MKFEVYKDGNLTDKLSLEGAYLFGVDWIPFKGPAKISFSKGAITTQKNNNDAAGLAIVWPIKGFGKVMIPTTRLPERQEPYNLNIELARAKLMEITMKREDWSFLEESSEKINQVKELFVKALENIHNGPIASVFADECLKKAMAVSELLAAKNAEIYLKAKSQAGGFAKHCMGCRVDLSKMNDDKYIEKLTQNFGFLSLPANWADIEKEKGEYDFNQLDNAFSSLAGKKIAISLGPLLNFDKKNIPGWLLKEKMPFEKIRESAYQFVNTAVSRYEKRVHAWRVISGMHAQNYFGFSYEQILEMTRAAIMSARAVENKSVKIVDVIYPWGEYYASCPDSIPPLVYIDMIMQMGINPDALGLQMVFGANTTDMRVRDMMQISSLLDKFAPVTKPIHLTSVEIPGAMETNGNGLEVNNGGVWRNKWSDTLQSKWLEQFYKIAFGKPFVNTVTYGSFADSDNSLLEKSGLMTEDLKEKVSLTVLKKFQKTLFSSKK